jgi:hypothetical protein
MSGFTRRDFLRGTAYVSLGMAMGLKGLEKIASAGGADTPFAAKNPSSTVVLIRDASAVDGSDHINAQVVTGMFDAAVKSLANENGVPDLWITLIGPEDTVGIKYSRCQWHGVPTEEAVVNAVLAGVSGTGVPDSRIHAADYGLPVEKCTALINVTSIKGHMQMGIAASLKNYINFTSSPSSYHVEGSVNLGEAWHLPGVKGKTRLVVVDALRPYFGPGPQPNPVHRWNYGGILVGTDPVAVDTVCLALLQKKRDLFKKEPWPINPPPVSVASADTKYQLGVSDPSKIKLVRLGWEKDRLV